MRLLLPALVLLLIPLNGRAMELNETAAHTMLEAVNVLAQSHHLAPALADSLLGGNVPFRQTGQNDYFVFYEADAAGKGWQKIDLRVPKDEARPSFLVMHAAPATPVTEKDIRTTFGEPLSTEPHIIPDASPTQEKVMHYVVEKTDLRFIVTNRNGKLVSAILRLGEKTGASRAFQK